ncbi:MAG: hypothetical protein GY832_18820 [Chloroflexi bacterium]|nr:hypothetical protein [Chloroflexota bacterium]
MTKYLVLWEMNLAMVPVDPKERSAGWTVLVNMVKQDFEKGLTKDWGAFPGELKGYFVFEGTEVELMLLTTQYTPYVTFKVHPVASVSQVEELLAAMAQ